MFQSERQRSLAHGAFSLFDLIFHNTVRAVRKGHHDAVFAILSTIVQNVIMILAFYLFMDLLGMRQAAIRGDFLLYIMSGVFMYMVHIKAMGAVVGAEGPASPMMQHLPMNTTIAIWSSALSALYVQFVSMVAILLVYHLSWQPLQINDPVGAVGILFLAWFSGCAIGSLLLAFKPWAPKPVGIAQQIYSRFNMFGSGKMFVANQIPAKMTALFIWNPLFHIIDQGRGYIFINYNPMKTNLAFPIAVSLAILTIGLIGESYTRKRVSASWAAKA